MKGQLAQEQSRAKNAENLPVPQKYPGRVIDMI